MKNLYVFDPVSAQELFEKYHNLNKNNMKTEFENPTEEQKELIQYWIEKFKNSNHSSVKGFYDEHLSPKPKIEVGKWYIGFDKSLNRLDERFLGFITQINENDIKGARFEYYGFNARGEWRDKDYYLLEDDIIEATEQEVTERLIEEANRRGFVNGAKFHPIFNVKEKIRKEVCICNGEYFSNFPNQLSANLSGVFGQLIMLDGKWADIIDENKEVKETIARLQAEIETLKKKVK